MSEMHLTHYIGSRIFMPYVMTETRFGHYMESGFWNV